MLLSPSRLARLALLGLGLSAATAAHAQTFGPAAPKRHYTASGKTYFRGPWRFTVGLGATYYNGDLTGDPTKNFINPAVDLGFLYRFSPHFMFGVEGGYFQLGARDYLPLRGLAFNARGGNLTGIIRYNILADRSMLAGGVKGPRRVMPFLQTGGGMMLFKPQAYVGVTSRPVGEVYLEPERTDYPAVGFTLPVAAGLTFHLNEDVNLSVLGTYYFTDTDSLDDISSRGGNPENNDGFGTLMAKLEFKL